MSYLKAEFGSEERNVIKVVAGILRLSQYQSVDNKLLSSNNSEAVPTVFAIRALSGCLVQYGCTWVSCKRICIHNRAIIISTNN